MPETLAPDEVYVLDLYRRVRNEGNGTLFIAFQNHECKQLEHKLGSGATELNQRLKLAGGRTQLRD